jgi:hypothetical protein
MGTEKTSREEHLTVPTDAEGTAGLSRRGIFAAVIGSLTAFLMSGIRPRAAEAHTDQLTKGQLNIADTETYLRSKVKGDKATLAVSNDYSAGPGETPSFPDGLRVFTAGTGGGAAIQAFGGPGSFSKAPHDGIGVRAIGTRTGVIGALAGAPIPVLSGIGVFGAGPLGVAGSSPNGTGVRGIGGRGVHGMTKTVAGVGVLAEVEEAGTAFEAKGPVKFSSAGLATIAAGTNSVTVSPGQYLTIDANSKILATLQSPGGALLNVIRNVVNNTFAINLTGNATADVIVAWFLMK